MSFPDAVGLVGVTIVLVLYMLVQTDRITADQYRFSLGNALGAGCILYSLIFDFNLSAFVIESCWVLISLLGFIHSRRKRRESDKGQAGAGSEIAPEPAAD